MHGRMFDETCIYLNKTNNKWLTIGIAPDAVNNVNEKISGFTSEVYLCGNKCENFKLGGLKGFIQLMRQLRELEYFKSAFLSVSI